jgi:hypothetical protein
MTCSAADLSRRWPDIATCESQEQLACVDALANPGTGASPATVQSCADALSDQACDAFLTGVEPPDACLPRHGSRALGAACGVAAQCQSGFCAVADDMLCGVCAAPPMAGDSCANSGCGPTLVCVKTTQVCQAPGAAGATCSKDLPCLAGNSCIGTTCQADATTVGAACDPKRMTGPDCSLADGLTCDTQSLTCVTQTLVPAGQPCGLVGTARTGCSGGATCSIPQGETKGVCVADAAPGAACNTDSAPACLGGARCVGNPRTCQLPGTATCD